MLALISPAKTMRSDISISRDLQSNPRFMDHTRHIISLMLKYSSGELEQIFKISRPIALELKERFMNQFEDLIDPISAFDSYDGVVYKHFKDNLTVTPKTEIYLQERVRISSLLYGLLRPFDTIHPYRMEGFVRLSDSDKRVDRYWRDIQTQTLINDVNNTGGTLLYLASKEEQNSFNWREVEKSVKVIDFKFLQYKGDKLRQVVVYTKMARGEMIRYMTENNITDINRLKDFEWAGYRYNHEHSTDNVWVWIMDS